MKRLKVHLWTLPRWFALPYFGASVLLGSVLAGGRLSDLATWLGFLVAILVMAGGHSFNTLLDYCWTKLDAGKVEDRSAEKDYTGGQNVIGNGFMKPEEVFTNAIGWYLASLIPLSWLIFNSTAWILLPWFLGCLCTVWYSISKFNYTHELALGVAVGPLPVLIGMLAVNPSPNIMDGILVGLPFAVTLSFLGLALDEWPDAEANLKKGVKSIAFMVWKFSDTVINRESLEADSIDKNSTKKSPTLLIAYCMGWITILLAYQVLLITVGILVPMTAISFIPLFVLYPLLVMLAGNFRKIMLPVVALGALYCIGILVGQMI